MQKSCHYELFPVISSEAEKFFRIKFADSKNVRIFVVLFREHSSVGLEHLPYKQRVGGSTPSAPTKRDNRKIVSLFLCPFLALLSGFLAVEFSRWNKF